MFPLLKQKV
jgi:hypothetical protein